MPKKNKPITEEILTLYDDTKKRYVESGIWGQWEQDESFYELDFKSKLMLPDEFKAEGVVLPTARNLVDTCCDNTDIFNVRIWVNKKGESKKSEDESNLLKIGRASCRERV